MEITLNLLCNSRVNPNLSAWAYLFGNYDFNRHPLAPPGTKVIVHSKPSDRASWEYHGKEGWYIGPALNHYRCITVYMSKTHSTRITDTVKMIPDKIPIPETNIDEHLKASMDHLLQILLNKKKSMGPFLQSSTYNKLIDLTSTLHRDHPPSLPKQSTGTPSPLATTSTPSEGVISSTSEGGGITSTQNSTSEGDTSPSLETPNRTFHTNYQQPSSHGLPYKLTNSTPSPPNSTPAHRQSPPISSSKSSSSSSASEYNIDVIDPSKLTKFLHHYIQHNKKLPTQRNPSASTIKHNRSHCRIKSSSSPPLSKTSMSPPTTSNRSITSSHPMRLRRRTTSPLYTPFKTLAAQHLTTLPSLYSVPTINHIYNKDGIRLNIDKLLALDPSTWQQSVSNELGRLADGINKIVGNNTIVYIPKHEVPKHKKITYANMVCDYRPTKSDPYRTRLTIGGDKLDYFGNA